MSHAEGNCPNKNLIESINEDSIKFLFEQFPPVWLTYFKGALVPLVMFDLLDGHTISLSGHLHFTDEGIFIVNRTTHSEDALCTQPNLARLVYTL